MPYIIRNDQGQMVGHCTNRPGEGNELPDGSPEIVEFYEDDPNDKAYDAERTAEALAYIEAQAAKAAARPALTVEQKLATIGLSLADLKAELAK